MRIAFTHNLQLSDSEEEAEFDSAATVKAISEALRGLGHDVVPVEVSGPASQTVARLEGLRPDLVFNTAEGRHGRFREAFYPALFERLGLPFTGSDAYVCTLTLDKQLTKLVLQPHGIPMPRGVMVTARERTLAADLAFPVICKPNYEGSSKGITQDSIVETPKRLNRKLDTLLARYGTGVLVEEYIEGTDVVVPFLELASPKTEGVLPAADYKFDAAIMAGRPYQIYEYDLKQTLADAVSVRAPAELSDSVTRRLESASRTVYRALGIRDLGRIDYRVTPEGEVYFIEVNALPSLEPGAGIYLSAGLAGLGSMEAVLEVVVRSASARWGLTDRPSRRRTQRRRVRVGLTHNLKRITPLAGGESDEEAEYDSLDTVAAIREAIESHGHDVVLLEATAELPALLPRAGVDVVFNVAEGLRGRNRESHVPALLELFDIPYTGSDPATLSLTLDKALAKRVVAQAGVRTPAFIVMTTGRERLPRGLTLPAVVKPLAEGSSKGVLPKNVVEDELSLRAAAPEMIARYRQPALVESYLPGREFTVGLLGGRRPKVLPPMEIVFTDPNARLPIYAFDQKLQADGQIRCDAPAQINMALRKEIERVARSAFTALGCRDVARIDLRMDADERVCFIECNPLPGLTPGWSDLCLIADSAGMSYPALVGEILAPAIRRLRTQKRELLVIEAARGQATQ